MAQGSISVQLPCRASQLSLFLLETDKKIIFHFYSYTVFQLPVKRRRGVAAVKTAKCFIKYSKTR